ncbi:MAG TPA: hypothetical protein VG269_18800 [Tepidisphaeraceae bacterium]|jgi:hypothetical protein|nr:hypothetical protein [Tepidisphaeraceae bacterium]
MKKDPNRYPKGWSRKKVLDVMEYYENQSEEDAIAEAEAAYRKRKSALVEIPSKLLPQVRRLLARGH